MRLDGRTGEGEEWKCEKARVRWKGEDGKEAAMGACLRQRGKKFQRETGNRQKGSVVEVNY